MPGVWRPIHENHAIDVMAVVITFAEPLPERLLRNVLRVCQESAFAAGLQSRHSKGAIRLTVDAATGGATAAQDHSVAAGLMFNRIFETEDGAPIPGKIAEQLQVDATSIVYRTWSYVSWSWQLERLQLLTSAGLRMFSDAVSLATIRLEYLDRFRWDLAQGVANVSSLLRTSSRHIAPSVFEATDLWHSHTGQFLPSDDGIKRLEQVHIDALDGQMPSEGETVAVRWLNIVTAREDRFPVAGLDLEAPDADIFAMLDAFHSELKDLLASVITDDAVERILLKDMNQ